METQGTGREEIPALFIYAVRPWTHTYTSTHINAWAHPVPQPNQLTLHNETLAARTLALSKGSSPACCYLLATV